MLTQQEYDALEEVLRRAPVTKGELLAMIAVMAKLEPPPAPEPPTPQTAGV